MMKALAKSAVAAAVLFLAIGQAQAATWDLSLADNPGTYSSSSYISGSTFLNNWSVDLDGLGAGFTASQGDTINLTIMLSSPYATEIGLSNSWLHVGLYGSSFPPYNTETSATTTFYLGGGQVGLPYSTILTSSGWLDAGVVLFPPDSLSAITFDEVTIDYTVGQIGDGTDTLNLTNATLYAQGQSPVPVPASLLLFGPGLAGLATIRRRFKK